MPELPEVEVTRRRIAPYLVGRRISKLHTTADSYFFLTQPDRLRSCVEGHRVHRLERLGKYLVAVLESDGRLVIHLGMTGQLFTSGATSVRLLSATARASLAPGEQMDFQPDDHTHLHFVLDGEGPDVYMRDVRKFGKVLFVPAGQNHPRLAKLGVDALAVTPELLFSATRKRLVPIKSLLLDQSILAGVGNIYADESLFLAGVRPARRASRVTRRECERIADGLSRVLGRSIESGGSSISDYVAPDGQDGSYQDERRVYARSGEPCRVCATPIRKIVVGQRGTHFCRICQR